MTEIPSIDKTHLKGEKYFDLHPIIPNLSIYNTLKVVTNSYKEHISIDCLDLNVSYEELINNSIIISKALKEFGVKENDIVTVSMPNLYQAVAVFLACNRIGATCTFLNSFSSDLELVHYLNLFDSKVFINYDKSKEENEKLKKETKLRNIITLNKEDVNSKKFNSEIKIFGYDDLVSFNDLGLVSDYYKESKIDILKLFKDAGSRNSLILFTSGTTGNPKAVVLTNKNILSSGIYMKNSTHISNTLDERCLVCVPFAYPYGFATSTLMSLLCGRCAILGPNLSIDNLPYYLSKKPNIIFGSPAMLELVKRSVPSDMDLSSIHTFISGGDFLTPSKNIEGQEFFKKHNANVVICNGSGNAETGGASTNAVGLESRIDTVGRVLLGSDVIIVDDDGNELKYNEEGLLCISGGHVFKEYFNDPDRTNEVKFNYNGKTYFKTGTRGYLDKDGYFTLTGRDSRYYITSTLNKVYLDRIGLIMSNIDVIDSVVVVPKEDDEFLWTSKAYIVLKEGILANEDTINYIYNKCKQSIKLKNGEEAILKLNEIPTSIDFIDKIPRTNADKIDYKFLEELAREEYLREKKVRIRK